MSYLPSLPELEELNVHALARHLAAVGICCRNALVQVGAALPHRDRVPGRPVVGDGDELEPAVIPAWHGHHRAADGARLLPAVAVPLLPGHLQLLCDGAYGPCLPGWCGTVKGVGSGPHHSCLAPLQPPAAGCSWALNPFLAVGALPILLLGDTLVGYSEVVSKAAGHRSAYAALAPRLPRATSSAAQRVAAHQRACNRIDRMRVRPQEDRRREEEDRIENADLNTYWRRFVPGAGLSGRARATQGACAPPTLAPPPALGIVAAMAASKDLVHGAPGVVVELDLAVPESREVSAALRRCSARLLLVQCIPPERVKIIIVVFHRGCCAGVAACRTSQCPRRDLGAGSVPDMLCYIPQCDRAHQRPGAAQLHPKQLQIQPQKQRAPPNAPRGQVQSPAAFAPWANTPDTPIMRVQMTR